MTDQTVALPFRTETILGVCEAIGEDFGFNANWLRVPFAALILISPLWVIGDLSGAWRGRRFLALDGPEPSRSPPPRIPPPAIRTTSNSSSPPDSQNNLVPRRRPGGPGRR